MADDRQLSHFITIEGKLGMMEMTNVVKHLNYAGYLIGFSQKESNKYQSHIIFTDVPSQFQWNTPTYAPILVVSKIQTEENLKEVDVSIGSEVLFLDRSSYAVYESYKINKISIVKYLGQFQTNGNTAATFFPSEDYIFNMENRRGNFYGLQLTGGIDLLEDGLENYLDFIKFIPNKDVYDVTNLVGDPEYSEELGGFFEGMVLKLMEIKFNFTSKLLLRRDQKFGNPHISSNGSAVIVEEGIFKDLIEGSIEFACGSFIMVPVRLMFVDFLPPMYSFHDAIFIPIEDSSEEIDWNSFLEPF